MCTRCMSTHSLKIMRNLTGSQCRLIMKRGSDVFSCSGAGDESGGCILNSLQWIDWRLRECCQNGVAVIHSGCHKSRYQTWREISTENSPDGFEAAKMEKAGTNDAADMVFHGGVAAVQVHSQIANHIDRLDDIWSDVERCIMLSRLATLNTQMASAFLDLRGIDFPTRCQFMLTRRLINLHKLTRTNFRKYFFSSRVIPIWNSLPANIVNASTSSL